MKHYIEKLQNYIKYRSVKPYVPSAYYTPTHVLDVISAWKGHERIIADIIQQFDLNTNTCLEFGVEFGFSTVVFANYFKKVTGVDIFLGDIHTYHKGDHYEVTKASLSKYENIELIRADYKDWIKRDQNQYDLIHVDIVHTYEDTYNCGLWSAKHSKCTIFHDTESFPDVKQAVLEVSKYTNKKFYNYPHHFGLGIIV